MRHCRGGLPLAQPVTIWPSTQEVKRATTPIIKSGLERRLRAAGLDVVAERLLLAVGRANTPGNEILKETAGDWRYASPSDGLYHGPNYNPFDPAFLPATISQARVDLLTAYPVGNTTYEQTVVQGVVTGDLFELPAGPLGVAVGARMAHLRDRRHAQTSREQNDEFWNTSRRRASTRGEDTVVGGLRRGKCPLLRGLPFIEELTLDGSARAFEYDSYGFGQRVESRPQLADHSERPHSRHAGHVLSRSCSVRAVPWQPDGLPGPDRNRPVHRLGQLARTPTSAPTARRPASPPTTRALARDATLIIGGGAATGAAGSGNVGSPDAWVHLDAGLHRPQRRARLLRHHRSNNQVAQLGPGAILGGCYGSPIYPNGVLRAVRA